LERTATEQETDVKITRVESILYDAGFHEVWCFVRVETDEGIVGIGEASTTEPYMVAAVVRRMAAWVEGRDPTRIQEFWQEAYRRHFNVRGGNLLLCAISGIEHALWDIKGKVAGMPVYDLLGGVLRDRVPVYANHVYFRGTSSLTNPGALGERAAAAVEAGYRFLKTDPFEHLRGTLTPAEVRTVTASVRAMRAAIGPDVQLGIDTHAKLSLASVIQVARAFEEFDLLFLEEPVPPENVEALRKVREQVRVPLASGERVYTKWGYRELLAAQAVEIIQPDLAHCGGILEARFIAAMAEAHYVQLAPHSYYGPVSQVASLHLDATIPNLLVQERPALFGDLPQRRELLVATPRFEDGCLLVPSGPGLGIAFNEEMLARHRVHG